MDRWIDMILNEVLMHFAPPPSSSPTPWANAKTEMAFVNSSLKNEAVAVSAVLAEPIGPEQNSERQVGL